jgi:hypothetical protein
VPLKLEAELVLLCEGKADRQFFRKFLEKRSRLAKFDIPFPTEKLHGSGAFAGMLQAIRGDRVGFARVKGVLIVADSTDKPATLFKSVRDQIRAAGGYGVPSKPLEMAMATNHPGVAIMLLPDEKTPGALETLLVREITAKAPWVTACVERFLRCDKIDAHAWPAEKRDKARFHSLVAVLNRDDPSRAASQAFRDPAPLVAVEAPCFVGVEKRLITFCRAVAVGKSPAAPLPG